MNITLVLILSLLLTTTAVKITQLPKPTPEYLHRLQELKSHPFQKNINNINTDYNETLALNMLLYSAVAYAAKPLLCLSKQAPNFALTDMFVAELYGTNVTGYAGIDKDAQQIILAFEGTMSTTQLLTELYHSSAINITSDGKIYADQFETKIIDVDIVKSADMENETLNLKDNDQLLVLTYFNEAVLLLLDGILPALERLVSEYPTFTVYVTGHSLGGSMASLMTYYLSINWKNSSVPFLPIVYTYGEPRTGNYAYSKTVSTMTAATYRIIHYRDVIPHLPPCTLNPFGSCVPSSPSTTDATNAANYQILYGYHNTMEIWYQEDMPIYPPFSSMNDPITYQICSGNPWGEDGNCSDSLYWYSVSDHKNYYNIEVGHYCDSLG